MDLAKIRGDLERFGQQHVLAFWDELDATSRQALLADISQTDLELVAGLVDEHLGATADSSEGTLEPPECLPAEPGDPDQVRLYAEARKRGESLIADGKVAAMVVAGGAGTRLGFDGPKGTFAISPVENKSLFQLFGESLTATRRRFGRPVRWYVMTSPATDQPTREFFGQLGYFGLDPDDVFFFQQGVMPAVNRDGLLLLAEKHRLATSPDGHGGSLRALASSGALGDMAARGIEAISYFQVDNPLVRPADPLFIGLHDLTGSEMSSLTIGKAADDERVGVFGIADGKLQVIEYSDLPHELSVARNPDGSRRFDAANIAVHVLSRPFVEELTASGSPAGHRSLPWHRAIKAVPFVDPGTGRQVTPDEPNAVKFEMFIFDALPLAANPLLLESRRGEVFSPVKNATGVDSPATARRDLIRRAAAWLEQCGVAIPRTDDGEPDCTLEISPLAALEADELSAVVGDLPEIEPGARVYISG